MVGGGSAVNGALALRGMPADYDRWAAEGCTGWDWSGLLPAFRRLETDLDVKNELHGSDGPVTIRRWAQSELIPIQQAFLGAAREAGFGWTDDHNDPASTGVGPFPMNRDGDIRLSTALTYVAQARSRPNLTVAGDTRVDRLVLERDAASRRRRRSHPRRPNVHNRSRARHRDSRCTGLPRPSRPVGNRPVLKSSAGWASAAWSTTLTSAPTSWTTRAR